MMKLLVIPGSTRRAAFSKQLARAIVGSAPSGTEITIADLSDFAMPMYDGDLEEAEGLPESAIKLREVVKQHDALLFVSPEYNASIPAVLKNTIDWLSRPYAPEPKVSVWAGKVAGLLSSSPGALQVVTEQFALGTAHEAFAADGSLKSDRQQAGVDKVVASVVRIATALAK